MNNGHWLLDILSREKKKVRTEKERLTTPNGPDYGSSIYVSLIQSGNTSQEY